MFRNTALGANLRALGGTTAPSLSFEYPGNSLHSGPESPCLGMAILTSRHDLHQSSLARLAEA
jgi:hypothetical protein